jgi:hypothetical protein
MKVLLDHNIPHSLRPLLADDNEVYTTAYLGWSDLEDDRLLQAAAEASFAAIVTLDRSLPHNRRPRPTLSASSSWPFTPPRPHISKGTWTASRRPCPVRRPSRR